jgi:hypothetical protein
LNLFQPKLAKFFARGFNLIGVGDGLQFCHTQKQMLDTPASVGSGETARLEPGEETVCAGERVENS